ncbi:preprotein translocase subunit YajC [Hymenobacter properus]|uniref:Sec translocon accessory complex subunit YajC n=1 Tax=Hymenobacter properus TaxID=2791026 RepID=A0A931FNR1_9BACT|nr:preprotein translocase subunit YajC [Hymenobacter properus]MBF9142904.1 preprotein translocase subunit YajC [Hymenobacter properus]MBR7721711.1 preprotein translocase subunit YajC [Microvirga sp. SRT04]
MFLTLLLQAASGMDITQLIIPIAIGLVFYFFMVRPQQKRTADAKAFRQSLTKGSRIVTIGGLHGLVVDLTDDTVVVEVDRGVKLRFDRTAIAREVGSKATAAAAETPAAS